MRTGSRGASPAAGPRVGPRGPPAPKRATFPRAPMDKTRRDRLASFVLLPVVLVAVGIFTYFAFRTIQVQRLRRESVHEATLGLAARKPTASTSRSSSKTTSSSPSPIPPTSTSSRALAPHRAARDAAPCAPSSCSTTAHDVLAFASRAGGASARRRRSGACSSPDVTTWTSPEASRRAPPPAPRVRRPELPRQLLAATSWQDRRYLVVAWHDIGRIVKDTLPTLYTEARCSSRPAPRRHGGAPSRVNVVDEDGRIIFGPPLRSGRVHRRRALPDDALQLAPPGLARRASESSRARVQSRRAPRARDGHAVVRRHRAGVVTILFAAERERRISALKSDFVANVSHELKTPLALVRMFGEMLQSGPRRERGEAPGVPRHHRRARASGSRPHRERARLRQVERGRQAYDFAEGDVGEAVAQGRQRLPLPRRARGGRARRRVAPEPPARAHRRARHPARGHQPRRQRAQVRARTATSSPSARPRGADGRSSCA